MVAAWIGNGDVGAEGGELANDVAAEAEVGEGDPFDILGLDGVGLETLEHDIVTRSERLVLAVRVEVAVAARGRRVPRWRSVKSRRGARSVLKSRRAGRSRAVRTVTVRRTLGTRGAVVVGRTLGRRRRKRDAPYWRGDRCTTDARCEQGGRRTRDVRHERGGPRTTGARSGRGDRRRWGVPCAATVAVRRTLAARLVGRLLAVEGLAEALLRRAGRGDEMRRSPLHRGASRGDGRSDAGRPPSASRPRNGLRSPAAAAPVARCARSVVVQRFLGAAAPSAARKPR